MSQNYQQAHDQKFQDSNEEMQGNFQNIQLKFPFSLTQELTIFGAPTVPFQQFLPQNNEKTSKSSEDEKPQFQQNEGKLFDLDKNIKVEVRSLYRKGQLYKDEDQQLPAMVSIKTQDIVIQDGKQLNNDQTRPEVDLICLIDTSMSMRGDRIELVKQTLSLFINILTEKDRLQLILFDETAEILTPLERLTKENKIQFQQKINKIQIKQEGTKIESGTELAFEQLKKRSYRNRLTSVFLLSDGEVFDKIQVEKDIKTQLTNITEEFTFHTFGIGEKHDSQLMISLSKLKNGNFYFLKNLELLNNYFVHAIGGILSVVGQHVELNIKCKPKAPFQNIKIEKTYGDSWQQIEENREYSIKLPLISSGQQKHFVFKLLIPKISFQIQEEQRMAEIIQVQLKITDIQTQKEIKKQQNLELLFFNENEEENVSDSEIDIPVAAQYQRMEITNIIEQVFKACEEGNFLQAELILKQKIDEYQKNKHLSTYSDQDIQQLKQALQASEKDNFNKYGATQMREMIYFQSNQQGCNSQFDRDGTQSISKIFNNTQQHLEKQIARFQTLVPQRPIAPKRFSTQLKKDQQ